VKELEREGLCGFVFKSRSPSSGMARVKVYDTNGVPRSSGVGLFAGIFMEHFPLLPVEEDGRLHDPVMRERFIERIFVFKRWREMESRGRSRGGIVDFHARHKLLVMSHSPKHATAMGRLVARAKERSPKNLHEKYLALLMEALKLKASTRKHTNVLHHIMGTFKKELSPDEKQELLEVIESFHQGIVPLIVPLTLVNHYVRKYDQPYLKGQHYLHPHRIELRLRNHV